MSKTYKSQKDKVLMPIDKKLAAQIKQLSEVSNSTPEELLGGLVWMARKMFGREVVLQSKDEKNTLSVHAFEKFRRITSLEDIKE